MTDLAANNACLALASVGAVVWTGGLIVLQFRMTPWIQKEPDPGQHNQINAGMACAAYGFLVPLLGLLAESDTTRCIAIALAVLYTCLTARNVIGIAQGLAKSDYSSIIGCVGYLLPTLMLALLAVFPNKEFLAWSSGGMIFASYFALSAMARRFP